jgi:hypothetical protein
LLSIKDLLGRVEGLGLSRGDKGRSIDSNIKTCPAFCESRFGKVKQQALLRSGENLFQSLEPKRRRAMQSCGNEQDVYISTILEDMFQYFDQELCTNNPKYRSLELLWKLKSAMIVFRHSGMAE